MDLTPFRGLQERVHIMKKTPAMSTKLRREYSAEFKAEAVKLVKAGGKQVTQLARELDVPRQVLHAWVRQSDRLAGKSVSAIFPGNGKRPADEAEIDRLRRELAQAKEDIEILKKATAFFAKQHR
jgi:transposase